MAFQVAMQARLAWPGHLVVRRRLVAVVEVWTAVLLRLQVVALEAGRAWLPRPAQQTWGEERRRLGAQACRRQEVE